jgi:hypothetical protein
MKEPKVGEIWQNVFLHSQGQETYEHVVKVEGNRVYCSPVGVNAYATGVLVFPLKIFMADYFYAFEEVLC